MEIDETLKETINNYLSLFERIQPKIYHDSKGVAKRQQMEFYLIQCDCYVNY